MNILLVGAGQLGSRHLQSLVKYEKKLSIIVLDKSEDSLKLAEQRALEINNASNHEIRFVTSLDNVLEKDYELLILATGANVRKVLLVDILSKTSIKYAILEKFLFQSVADFEECSIALADANVTAYVNCPLRTYPFFTALKEKLLLQNSSVNMEYSGGEWVGLACNSIHYIDLINFFTDEKLVEVKLNDLDAGHIASKRKGFIELTGKIKLEYSGDSRLEVSAIRGSSVDSIIKIECGKISVVIDELTGNYKMFDNSILVEKSQYNVVYQSDLTHKILGQLIESKGSCELTTFEKSKEMHIVFLNALLSHYNTDIRVKTLILPIT